MTPCNDHHTTPSNSGRLWLVFFLSLFYMVAEIVGGIVTGSLGLLADAGHMATDTGAIALALFANWIGRRPPSEAKTYGYYRAEILGALGNGVALVGASIWILKSAVVRLSNPPEVQGEWMALVAFGGLVVNIISLFILRGKQRALNTRAVWLHLLGDTLGSVGVTVAGVLIWQFQWYLADPILSILLSIFIMVGAARLLFECVNVLLEGVPKHIDLSLVKKDIEATSGVKDVHDLHVWLVNQDLTALSAHITVEEGADNGNLLGSLTALLKSRHGILHVTLQLEPKGFGHEPLHV